MDLRGFRKRWAAAPLSSVGSPSTPALESEPAGAALEFADVDSGFALGNNPNASNSSTGFSLQHVSQKHVQQTGVATALFCSTFLKASEAALGDRTPCTGVHS